MMSWKAGMALSFRFRLERRRFYRQVPYLGVALARAVTNLRYGNLFNVVGDWLARLWAVIVKRESKFDVVLTSTRLCLSSMNMGGRMDALMAFFWPWWHRLNDNTQLRQTGLRKSFSPRSLRILSTAWITCGVQATQRMFNSLSIRHKLAVLLGLSAGLGLAISSAITLYSTYIGESQSALRLLRQLAGVTSENMRAALAFRDERSAQTMLDALKTNPNILFASVLDEDGQLLGHYRAASHSEAAAKQHDLELRRMVASHQSSLTSQANTVEQMSESHMYVLQPIFFEDKPIGVLSIVSDKQDMRDKMSRFIFFQVLVSLLTLAILIVLSLRLQRLFTRPIFELIDAMQGVAASKDYSSRAFSSRKDEFNDLHTGFNTMLGEIRDRDLRLSKLATTDTLTGLANRRHAMDTLQSLAIRANRKQEPLGVIILDVDLFKHVNDTYGHPVGDLVLKQIASILQGCSREYDLVGRIGGEEFLILCDGADSGTSSGIAERIRSSVEAARIELEDGRTLQVTVSLGVNSTIPSSVDIESLIKNADEALYRAKQSGRNRIEIGKPC